MLGAKPRPAIPRSIDSEGATIIAEKILQTNDWSWLDVVKDRLDLEALDSNVVTVEEVYQASRALANPSRARHACVRSHRRSYHPRMARLQAFKAHAGDEGDEGDESSKDLIFVISAFECPKIVCDPIRRTFFLAKEPPKVPRNPAHADCRGETVHVTHPDSLCGPRSPRRRYRTPRPASG